MAETVEKELISLPTKRSVAPAFDVISKLGIVGHQGTGKTMLTASLPNSLLIDFEDGCKDHYEAMSINLKKIASENNVTLGQAFIATLEQIKKANKDAGKFVYDYIVYDGITAMEKLSHTRATNLFKASIVGKGMINKGAVINDVVTDVPESGWLWFKRGWDEIYDMTVGLSGKCSVYIGHAKQGSLVKQGIKLETNDLNLAGKAKVDFLRDIDACGMIYREGNKCKISFKINEKDQTIKSRARHLNEKEFVISEYDDVTNKLTTHWDLIFPELK